MDAHRFEDISKVSILAEEWLEEYTTGKKVLPGSLNKIANSAKIGRDASLTNSQYKYVGHRTLRRGGLILAFEDLVTYEEAICFFNVDIFGKHRRGKMKNISFRPGAKGEFYPEKRSKFRKFWMCTIGQQPLNGWSRAHIELHARLKNKTFTGEIKQAYGSHGAPYKELLDPRVI